MSAPIIKEEKIEVKQGLLKMPGDRLFDTLKSWKQRYFVFCQIRRGDSSWLRLFYYKNSSVYKEGRMPKDFIDITNASSIGMMDQGIDGYDHIICISTPGKTYYLSASSCDDRSQWLLALRAYKYNDESKLPSTTRRTYSWYGERHSHSEAATRRVSEPALPPFIATDAKIEKFRAKYMICRKCRGIDVPREVYEWVQPYDCEIYTTIHHRPQKSDNERIYEEPRFLVDDTYSIRKALPLPFIETSIERSKSCVELRSERNSRKSPRRPSVLSDTQLAFIREMSDEEDEDLIRSLPGTSHAEGYVSMTGKTDEIEDEKKHPVRRPVNKSISVPSSSVGNLIEDNPQLNGSQAKCDSIFSQYIEPSGKTAFVKTSPATANVVCNRYTKDPTGSKTSKLDVKGNALKPSDDATPDNSLNDSKQKQFPDNRQASLSAEKQNSASGVGKHMLESRYGIEDPVFIAYI